MGGETGEARPPSYCTISRLLEQRRVLAIRFISYSNSNPKSQTDPNSSAMANRKECGFYSRNGGKVGESEIHGITQAFARIVTANNGGIISFARLAF